MSKKVVKACEGSSMDCERCGRLSDYRDGWALRFADGTGLGFVCPDCLTEAERFEMAVRAAVFDADGNNPQGLYPVELFAGCVE